MYTSLIFRKNEMNIKMEHRFNSYYLSQFLLHHLPSDQDIVVLCIGTDRCTGDSLGPLVGSLLKAKPIRHLNVYGTLEKPVHAKNLHDKVEEIYSRFDNPYVIAIDAALSSTNRVKTIDVGIGSLLPGAAVNKKHLNAVGDLYIKGYVNVAGFLEYTVLQNTRLADVMKLAQIISKGCFYADIHLEKYSDKQKAT